LFVPIIIWGAYEVEKGRNLLNMSSVVIIHLHCVLKDSLMKLIYNILIARFTVSGMIYTLISNLSLNAINQ